MRWPEEYFEERKCWPASARSINSPQAELPTTVRLVAHPSTPQYDGRSCQQDGQHPMGCYGDSGRLHQTLGEPGSGLRLSPLLPEDDSETHSQVWRAGISEPGGAEGSNPTKCFILDIF